MRRPQRDDPRDPAPVAGEGRPDVAQDEEHDGERDRGDRDLDQPARPLRQAAEDEIDPDQRAVAQRLGEGEEDDRGHAVADELLGGVGRGDEDRAQHDLDQDVKLYFVVANVASDAFISCWETKRYYDSSRPWTLVRHYFQGQTILGWAGPEGGVKEMPVEEWHPYSPYDFITPPFPGYTSGHATVSGACSKALELFTGSDVYGFIEQRRHCELTEVVAGEVMTLDLPTWSATAEMAALSRALGGYHIPIDNEVGLRVGRDIANWSWPRYQAYFDGTAEVRP